jgi:hypothetical protein
MSRSFQDRLGQAYDVPGDAYVLRLTGAIELKSRKYLEYAKRGYIKEGDTTIIAISAAKLNFRFNDLPTPRIVSAVLAAGPLTVHLDRQTGTAIDEYLAFRESIKKNAAAIANTDMFLRPECCHVSAVLYSVCD